MGTSKESQRNNQDEEGEIIIPWSFVNHSLRRELIKKLNPEVTITGNNWRMLASYLGYDSTDINYIESEKENNTTVLFKEYDTKPGASLNQIYKILELMQREDCLEIIRRELPGIKEDLNKAHKSSQQQSSELAATSQFHWSGSAYPCSYSNHPVSSACASRSCYSCPHNFASFAGACHVPGLGPCPPSYLMHLPYNQCPSHFETMAKTCESLSSAHHSSSPVQSYYLPAPALAAQSPAPSPPMPSPGSQHVSRFIQPGWSPGQSTYQRSPTYNHAGAGHEDNVLAESTPCSQPFKQTSPVSFNIGFNPAIKHPAAISETVFRSPVDLSLPNNINALDNSNLTSGDSNNSDSSTSRPKISRQYSQEYNMSEAMCPDKRFRVNNSNSSSGESLNQASSALVAPISVSSFLPKNTYSPKTTGAAGHAGPRDNFFQQRPEIKENNTGHDSLASISHRATSNTGCSQLNSLISSRGSNNLAEQKGAANKGNLPTAVDASSCPSSDSSASSLDRSHPSTFPMRMKMKGEWHKEDLKQLTETMKSTSLPHNMKPVQFRKAFRNIKVFVTYSYDSDNHGKLVLSLCKFLQDNGFACCVDVCWKTTSAKSLDQLNWCRHKVLEADFVLVCISDKYLEDISNTPPPSLENERKLHTREIFRMMHQDHLDSQLVGESARSAHQFVPLLFPNMRLNQVPDWLAAGPAYVWPSQYKDLAWMLTKPQDRVPVSESSGSRDLKAGMAIRAVKSPVVCRS